MGEVQPDPQPTQINADIHCEDVCHLNINNP